jgi:OmpA-OmpF porin, OOP family
MWHIKLALCAPGIASVLGSAQPASAQASGFALSRFDPSERGSEWFVLDSLDLRGHMRPAIGVVGDWAYKPLVVYNPDGSERSALVEHQLITHLGGSLVLWDRIRGSLNLPIAAYQTGESVTRADGTRLGAPGPAFGDLRAAIDVRILGEHGSAFNSTVGVAVYLPTGSRDNYTSDQTVRMSPRAMVAGDIDIFSYAGRLGFNYRPLTDRFDANPLGSELTIGASAGVRLLDRKLLVGPELYGSTVTDSDSFFERRTTPLEWLLGAHYTVSDFRVGGGVGTGLTRGWGTPVVRTVLSVEWVPSADKDTDGDGIMDREDACPTVPGIRTTNPRTNGCPPPMEPAATDRDGDGILDPVDACPDVPGVASEDPAKHGCPADRDGDGIPDDKDACPDVPGVPSDDPQKHGCPPDRDGDGIPDDVDACPDVPGVRSDDPAKNGCPPDRDGDGIADPEDACPDVPGPRNEDPKKHGCPEARIEDGQIKILQQVKFKVNSAEILRESDPTLIAVATILKDHPDLAKVRVEGHTDNTGKAAYNKQLSNRRAASVVKWLVAYGIDKKRLSSTGLGLERPIDSNATDEGRAQNRRVEFHIESTKPAAEGQPTPPAKKQ